MSGWYEYPEPEWMGTMEFTCSAESERKIITPALAETLKALMSPVEIPWKYPTVEDEQRAVLAVWGGRVAAMKRELSLIQEQVRTCAWEGETDAVVDRRGHLLWTCPACGEEHDDPAPDPDMPEPYDTLREARGEA